MNRFHLAFLLTNLLLFSIISSNAWGHRVLVFAYEEDGKIVTEAKFSSGRPIQNGTVNILTENGTSIAQGVTGSNGIFHLPLENISSGFTGNLKVEVSGGDGHKGSWTLSKEDLSDHTHVASHAESQSSADEPPKTPEKKNHDEPGYDSAEIEKIVQRSIEKELVPLKRMLVQQQEKTRLQDILGGIGYILGLAGLAAYLKSKKGDN